MKKALAITIAGLFTSGVGAYYYQEKPQIYHNVITPFQTEYRSSYNNCNNNTYQNSYHCPKQTNINYHTNYTPVQYPYNNPHQYPKYSYKTTPKQQLSIIQKNVFPNRIDVWVEKNINGANAYDMTCTPYNTIYAGAQVEKAGLCNASNSHTPLTINNLFSDVDYECRIYALDKQGKTLAEEKFWIHTPSTQADEIANTNSRTWYHLSQRYFGGKIPEWGSGKTYKPNKCLGTGCNQ